MGGGVGHTFEDTMTGAAVLETLAPRRAAMVCPASSVPPASGRAEGDVRPAADRVIVFDERNVPWLMRGAGGPVLPQVHVRPGARTARVITHALRTRHGIETVRIGQTLSGTHLMRLVGCSAPPHDGVWCHRVPDHMSPQVRYWLDEAARTVAHAPGVFLRAGWFVTLRAWMASIGLRLVRIDDQIAGGAQGQILRLEVEGDTRRHVWFKAVSCRHVTELVITPILARENPGVVPAVIDTLPHWRGWLQEDAGRRDLRAAADTSSWERTARAIARLQIRYAGSQARLRGLGCRDLRPDTLARRVPAVFAALRVVMARQTSTKAPRLTARALTRLERHAERLIVEARVLAWPVSLTHEDISPYNVMLGADDRPRIIDWAEAGAGLPFLTLAQLIVHRHGHPSARERDDAMWRAYADEWRPLVSAAAVREARRLAGVLTPLVILLRTDVERIAADPESPRAAMVRTVARQFARALEPGEARTT